jgi:prepilin-type N-terminal cleavage/methylation domain-containing protein
MTNLFDRLPLPPRADVAAGQRPAGAAIVGASLEFRSGGSLSRGYGRGLTLIEMLVALAVTLVMMAAVVNLFANMSASIRNRRAAIETGSQLRQVRNRLAMDLSGATCRGSTWQDPAENQGYIEIIEGEWSDKNPSNLTDGQTGNNELDYTTSLVPSSQAFDPDSGIAADGRNLGSGAVTDGRGLGDWDDVLALTVRSESDPFTARVRNPVTNKDELVESPLAEVFWFAQQPYNSANPGPNDGFRRIDRKVLLIAPWLGPWTFPPDNVSAHLDQSTGQWVANTLGDLTKRENRSYHDNALTSFPHRLDLARLNNAANSDSRVLDSSLAFDVRVFDPGAPLYALGNDILEPNDYGWAGALATAGAANASGYGAYCDLGWGFDYTTGSMAYQTSAAVSPAPLPLFNEIRPAGYHQRSSPQTNAVTLYPAAYDTWSYHYENDGINQDSLWQTNAVAWQMNTIDQGANGLDDDNANGVDDRGERETSPPYDVPLRGVKVILRVYEPDSRQIRESSVTHSFKQ